MSPSQDVVLRQLERILAGAPFRNAPALARFLSFVVRARAADPAAALKEYTIGVEVFGRGEAFDPRADSVVRVQAGVLRRKLADYYGGEGHADALVVTIPKGGYAPTFTARAAAVAPPRRRWQRPAIAAAASVSLLAAAVAIAVGARRPDDVVWSGFFDGRAPVVLALGTPQFFRTGDGLLVRDVQVNGPDQRSAERLDARTVGELRPVEIYTGLGEAAGAAALVQHFARAARPLKVVRSRLVGWDALKDAHVIFLGSMRFRTLADELAYRAPLAFSVARDGVVEDAAPPPGAPREYPRSRSVDLALITVGPGKTPGRRVMVLEGGSTWGTQAAAEYLTTPEHLAALRSELDACAARAGRAAHPPDLQVLLRVEIKDDQPVETRYVTHRDLPATPPPLASARPASR